MSIQSRTSSKLRWKRPIVTAIVTPGRLRATGTIPTRIFNSSRPNLFATATMLPFAPACSQLTSAAFVGVGTDLEDPARGPSRPPSAARLTDGRAFSQIRPRAPPQALISSQSYLLP